MIFSKQCQWILLLWVCSSILLVDGSRSRRRRRQTALNNDQAKSFDRQRQNQGNEQRLINGGQPTAEKNVRTGKNAFANRGQPSRQYGYGGGQYGYGSVMGLNYPYAGAGVGSYQYGSYYPTNQMGGMYGSSYNQYPSSNSFYGANYYNRPGYSNSYYSPYGSSYYGGYYYGHAATLHQRKSLVVLCSSLCTLIFTWISLTF